MYILWPQNLLPMYILSKKLYTFLLVGTALTALTGRAQNQAELVADYNKAIRNSSYTANSKISSTLFPVADNNKQITRTKKPAGIYVLAVSWKGDVSYYPRKADSLWGTGPWDSWVTISPELREKMRGIDSSRIDMRLKQLLGLPPGASYGYFVEMWVQPQDLFRPCPDKEITDNSCGICFPPSADTAHIRWINEQRISRFFVCDTAARYPWTQLGYTYDWSPENPTHVGCSEYVIRKNAKVYINRIYTTNEYLYHKND